MIMPFKKGKSFDDINAKISRRFKEVLPAAIERGLYSMGFGLQAAANHYVPVDTSNLVNSARVTVEQSGETFRMTLGYYSNYAAALHSPEKGSKMDGWKPKPVPSPGKKTGGYNPQAKQDWMNVAWREDGPELLEDFKDDIS